MAYNLHYQFRFESEAGRDFTIDIYEEGYSGAVLRRALGSSPRLELKHNDNGICSTSLTITAECQLDQEFASFFSSDPYKFYVHLYRTGGDTLFRGCVACETYAEPDIAPPYDVVIKCSDNLSQLKYVPWENMGRASIRNHIRQCLAAVGSWQGSDQFTSHITLLPQGVGCTDMLNCTVQLAPAADATCYDVLEQILSTLNAFIVQRDGAWHLYRNNTVQRVAAQTAVLGQWRPVGKLSREVIPARNSVTSSVKYDWDNDLFVNGSITQDTAWIKTNGTIGTTRFRQRSSAIALPIEERGYYDIPGVGSVSQTIANLAASQQPLTLSLLLRAMITDTGTIGLRIQSGEQYYNVNKRIWDTTAKTYSVSFDANSITNVDIKISSLPAGNLTVTIYNNTSRVQVLELYAAHLSLDVPGGKVIRATVANGAREKGDDKTVCFADLATISGFTNLDRLQTNAIKYNNTFTSAWKDSGMNISGSFEAFMATDHALTYSMPRILMTGTLMAKDIVPTFLLDTYNTPYYVRSYKYDLAHDEIDIEAESLVSVAATDIIETTAAYYSQSAMPGSSAGGSTSGGAGSSSAGGSSALAKLYEWFEFNEEEEAIHALYPLYTDGWLMAGGVHGEEEGGQGGSVFDITALWQELAPGYTEGDPKKIDIQFLPDNIGGIDEAALEGYVNELQRSGSSGGYIASLSKNGKKITYTMGNLPEALPNPEALTFANNDTYDGSEAKTLLPAHIPNLPWSKITSGKPTTISGYGITDAYTKDEIDDLITSIDIDIPEPDLTNYYTKRQIDSMFDVYEPDLPEALPNPEALTFGSKTYDGSSAEEITLSDLGGLSKSGGTMNNNATISGSGLRISGNGGALHLGNTSNVSYVYIDEDAIFTGSLASSTSNPNWKITKAGAATFKSVTADTFTGNLTGTATKATKLDLSAAVGSVSRPVYFTSGGVPEQVTNIDVPGYIVAQNTSSSSDMRLKKDVEPLGDVLELIEGLRLFRHGWKESEGETIGLSAQQLLQTALACLVREDERGYYAVEYSKLAVVALRAVQQLMEKIKELEGRINVAQ